MTSVVDPVSVEGTDSGIYVTTVTVLYTLICNLHIKIVRAATLLYYVALLFSYFIV